MSVVNIKKTLKKLFKVITAKQYKNNNIETKANVVN